MNPNVTQVRSVILERDLTHPPEKVWRALTQPPLLSEWLMANDFKAAVGRRFDFSGDWGAVNCEVLEIEPCRFLAYTWTAMGLESVVTWTLRAEGDGTHLRMEHTGFRHDQQQAYEGAQAGWRRFLANLDGLLSRTD